MQRLSELCPPLAVGSFFPWNHFVLDETTELVMHATNCSSGREAFFAMSTPGQAF